MGLPLLVFNTSSPVPNTRVMSGSLESSLICFSFSSAISLLWFGAAWAVVHYWPPY